MQIHEIEKIIQHNSLFNSLTRQELEWVKDEILPRLETVDYGLGDDIIWAGDRTDSFYIIATGKARLIDRSQGKNITLAVLNKGDSFGEHCLLSLDPSPITVRASGSLTLLKLGRIEFDRLVEKIPSITKKLNCSIHQQQEFRFLRTLNVFSDLKLSEAYQYQQNVEQIKIKAGDYLFQAGQPAEAAYIIRSGNIHLVKNSAEYTTLDIVREGQMCGETALLFEGETYPISAIAASNVVVLCLPKFPFSKIRNHSKIGRYLTQISQNRHLQCQAIIESEKHDHYQSDRSQNLYLKTVSLKQGKIKSRYTFAAVDEPKLAGIASLATINQYWKRDIDLQPIIEKKLSQNDSEDIISLSRIAESLGYLTRLLHLNNERLSQVSDFPAVVEYNGILCLMLSVSPVAITLVNPLTGIVTVNRDEFIEHWNRKLLTLKIVPNFGKVGKEAGEIFQQFLPLLLPYWKIFAWVGLISFAMQILGLAGPLFSQIVIDRVLAKGDYSLLFLITL